MQGIEDQLNRIIAPLLREIIFKKEITKETKEIQNIKDVNK